MIQFNTQAFNIDLLAVGIVAAAIALLGVIVFLNNPKHIVNRTFLFFTIMTLAWSFSNFLQYQLSTIEATLLAMRANLFIATWHAVSFFQLALVFRKNAKKLPRWFYIGLIPTAFVVSLLALTPFVFSGIEQLASGGEITNPTRGSGIVVFSVFTIGILISALSLMFVRTIRSEGIVRTQTTLAFIGMTLTASLIIALGVILPVFLNQLSFLPFAAFFLFPFIALIFYTIYRHQLFNIKVILVETLVFVLGVIVFVEVIFTKDPIQLVARIFSLILIVFVGILLTRSVMREVEQRERIEQLAQQLTKTNERLRELDRQKSEFLSIAAHQLRTPLSAISGYASLILEGTYGALPEKMQPIIETIFSSTIRMVDTVSDFLNVARIEQGRLVYRREIGDLGSLARRAISELAIAAKEKDIDLNYRQDERSPYPICADISKIEHVITNLIDNAIKYTPPGGHITVRVAHSTQQKNKAVIQVIDTGCGIPQSAQPYLFDKFIRARNAQDINVTGTGLGLYVAREMVKAHRGTIKAESAGEGRGATFTVILPMQNNCNTKTQESAGKEV